jgi:hypothetical protein
MDFDIRVTPKGSITPADGSGATHREPPFARGSAPARRPD